MKRQLLLRAIWLRRNTAGELTLPLGLMSSNALYMCVLLKVIKTRHPSK